METLLQETDVDITRFPNLSKTDEEMDEYDRIQQRIARYNEALAVRSGYKDEGKPEGYSDEAWTALRRGGEQLKMMLYAGAAAAGEITGAKSLQDWGETEALRKIDEINKRFAPSVNSFMDVPGDSVGQTFDNAFRYLLSAAGETIPTMIPSLIAGAGVGAIAGQVGKKALVAKATEQLTRNLTARYGQRKAGEMIARHALNIKRIADAANAGNVRAAQMMGAFGVNYPLAVGEVYQGMMDSEEGASGALAFGFGVPFAALDTLPEVMAIDKLIGPGAGRRFAKTFADRAKIAGITDLQLALSETGTEVTQDIIAKAAAMINDPSKKFTDQDFVDLADVAIRTFIGMGSTFGAAAGLRQAVIAPSSDPRVNQKQSEIERKAAEMSTPFGAAGIINEERQRGTGRPEAEIIADQARLENEEAQLRRELETAQEEEAVRIRASIEEIERRKADNAAELTRLRNQDGGRFGEAEGSQLQEDGAEAERGAEEGASPEFAAKLQAVTSRFMAGRTRSPDERQRGILQEIARKEIARDKITERLRALSERPEQASPAEDAEFSALAKTEKALGTDIAELTASLRIDPSETKPIRRSKSPAVPAYLRDNPFSRPRYEVKKSEIDAIIDGARESDPRDAETKEWLKEAIDQYIPLIDELGVKVEYGKTGRAGYNYQTNAILLPSPEEYRKAASYGKDDLSKIIEEEAIHAAQFKALRDEFEASTDTNFGSFLKKKIDRLVEDIERADSDILKKIARGYIGPRAKVTDNTSRTQLYIEFERAVIQRMRTGQLTEDLRAAKKEAQAGSAAARTFIDSVLEALERYRAAIVRFINRATSPKRIQERLKQVNAILDEFGIINRPTQLDSTIVSDTNESNIPTGQRELQRQDQQEEAGGTAQNQKTQQEQSLPQEEGLVSSAADDVGTATTATASVDQQDARFSELTASITPDTDLEVWKAENPEAYAELKKMREKVLREAGYDVGPVIHQTNASNFTEFDIGKARNTGRSKVGFFFTDNPDVEYGRNTINAFLESKEPLTFDSFNAFDEWASRNETSFGDTASLRSVLREKGYDSIEIKGKTDGFEQTITVVLDPSQIKSAEPLNRDENGNLIPPSQWANPDSNDIRYSKTRSEATAPKGDIEKAIRKITDKIAGSAKVKFVSSVPATVRANLASLKNRMGMLKISKETHPTVVSWLAKNDRVVPWATVRTLDQLKEFVASRLAERMQPEQYEITVEGSVGAEQAELAALRARADDGDREAARALELHRQGGWKRVLDGYVNPQRKASIDTWKRYLTKENEEYAKDVFWQDLAWDIPESYLRSDRGRGLGETVNLNQGALAQLREETQTKNISLPKAYRELMRQFAIASAKDKVSTGQGKTWIYIPWKGEDPENFAANVQKLKDLSNDCYCTKTYNAEPYLSEGSFWMLQENGRTKVAIRLNEENSRVAEIKSEDNTDQIPEEYVDDVMGLLKQRNIPGAELFIAQNEKDPQRQIELANNRDWKVQYALALNPNIAFEAQLILSKSSEAIVISGLSSNPGIDPQIQIILAENEYAQSKLARNPNIIPEVQLIIAKSGSEYAQSMFAENPSIIPEAQLILAKSGGDYSKSNLAANRSIVPEAQLILAKSGDEITQSKLAQNRSIAPEAQLILVKSGGDYVQSRLAENPSIAPEAQLILAKSGDETTQNNLARNPSIAPEAQLIIAKSDNQKAQYMLAETQSIVPEAQLIIAKSGGDYAQYTLAENQSIVPEAQLILVKSGDEITQNTLARNPSIVPEVQLILAKGNNEWTKKNLARNPSLAPEARQLLKDKGIELSKTSTDIEAYYDPANDELVFNTSAIDSMKRAEELAYHEVNHRNVFMLAQDDAGRAELKNIIAAARPILRQNLQELLAKTGHTSIEQLKSDYGWNDENGDVAVDYELLARYAENLRGRKPPSWFERIISEIKLWLNKNFGTGLADKDVLHWLSRIGVDKTEIQAGGDIQASRRASVDQQDARFSELTASITPDTDLEVWKAENPEAYAELEKMREDVLKRAGYTIEGYHGSNRPNITVFKTDSGAEMGPGAYFTPEQSRAQRYGKYVTKAFLKIKNPVAFGFKAPPFVKGFFDKMAGTTTNDKNKSARAEGYDAAVKYWSFKGDGDPVEFAVFYPSQIKSAEPLNRDENGNLIPPSQWANPESDSILFSPEQQTETTQDEALAEINQIGTDQLTKSLLGFAEEMEGKPRKRVSQASWAYKLGAAIKYDSQTNKESFEKAADYIRSRGILKVMRTFANDRSSIPQTLQNIIGPALNAYFDTFASMAQGLDSVASLPADQRLELQSEITSLAPRLNASGFNNASEAGRALQILKKTQIFAGKWDRMATLERMLSPYIKKLEKSTRANVKDLAVNLTRIADLAQEEVITIGEKVNAAIELIKRATADPKKFVRGSKASMAKNRAALKEAIDRIVFEASDAIHKFGGDEHAYQLARKLKHIIAPVRGGTDPEKSVDAMIVKALNEVFKESLRMDPTGPKKVTKTDSVRALNLLKQAIGNDTLKNQILDNLENQIAAGYAKGKSDPQYIADGYPQAFEAAREKDYARSVLEGAMKEAEQNLNVIVNKLIETSWGAGMDSIGQIKSYFREKLGGIASKEVIDRLVEDVDATLTNRAIRRLEELATFTVRVKTPDGETKTITLEEYYSDPDFYERLSSSIGGAKLIRSAMKDEDGIRTTLNQVVKMGRTRKDKYANAIAQNIIQEMGIPEEYATAMQNLIVSEIKLAVKDRMTQNIKRELDKLEESAKKNESSQEARKTMLDKLIEYAASGYLHEEKIYESIRKAHPKLKLPPWSIEMAEKIEALGEIADTSTGFLKERAQSEIVKEIVRSQPISKEEMVTTWWYYSLLSGPATTILNLGSSLLNSFLNTFWHAIQNPSKFRMTFQAFIEGIRNRGIPEMMYALKTGLYSSDLDAKYPIISILEAATPESHPTFYKVTRFGDIPILKYTSPVYVFRILKATDLLFRGAAMEARLATLDAKITQAQREEARAQAIEEIGPETKENKLEIEKRTNEIIDEKIAAVNSYAYRSAVQDSRRAVFTQEPEGVIGMLARMIGSLSERQPAIKAVVPFTNIVANVLNEQLNYTPIGFARYYMSGLSSNAERKDFLVENANGDFVQDKTIFMKALVGTLAAPLLMLASWATEDDEEEKGWFRIYGSGPRDPELRRAWQQQGHRPYSIEINGVIINYLPTPFSVMLGAIGTFMDAQREAKDYRGPGGVLGAVDQSASIAFALLGAAFASTLNQSFLSGVQSLVDVANANNPADAMKRFLGGTASSFITPGNVRELFRTIDPRVFESPTIVGQVFRNWPVVGPSLNRPALNRYGEEVNRNQWPLFGRFIGVVDKTDPVFAVAAERGLNIPDLRASAVMGGQRMDYDTAYRFTEIAGPILKQLDYASLPSLRTASIEQANEILARNRRIAAARARAVMRVTAAAQ